MGKTKLIKVQQVFVDNTPLSIAVLMVLSIVVFQLLVFILNAAFDFPIVKMGVGFFLMLVGFATILPFALIMGFKIERGTVWMIILVLALDIIFFAGIGPKVLPQVFSALPPQILSALPLT